MEETVLCYIEKDNRYLMLLRNKKKHDLNANKYLGIGGHIENNETPKSAIIREVKEETGLFLNNVNYRGKILFINDDYQELMHLFTSNDFSGELIDCNEGTLYWTDIDKVLSLPLWEGDKYFLSLLTENVPYFELTLKYSSDKLIDVIRTK